MPEEMGYNEKRPAAAHADATAGGSFRGHTRQTRRPAVPGLFDKRGFGDFAMAETATPGHAPNASLGQFFGEAQGKPH